MLELAAPEGADIVLRDQEDFETPATAASVFLRASPYTRGLLDMMVQKMHWPLAYSDQPAFDLTLLEVLDAATNSTTFTENCMRLALPNIIGEYI